MIKTLLYLAIFLALFSIETSFIYSLPSPVDRIPLVITAVVFLYLYVGFPNVLWWMVFHGILLDTFSLSFVPFHWLAYVAAAVVTLLASRHVFSNRSFYGVAATTTIAIATLMIMEVLLATLGSVFGSSQQFFGAIVSVRLWGMGLGALLLLLIFPVAPKLKSTLGWVFQQYR